MTVYLCDTNKVKNQVIQLIERWDHDQLYSGIKNHSNFYTDNNSGRIDMQSKITGKNKYNIQVQVKDKTYSCILVSYEVYIGREKIKALFYNSMEDQRVVEDNF